jgi:DNA segregation ATPase FtsK/SpoIIIE, S-DNA-T family
MAENEKLFLQAKENIAQEYERKKITLLDRLKNLEHEIIKSAEKSKYSPNSILKIEELLLDDSQTYTSVPQVLRIGELTPTIKDKDTSDVIIPAFLPFARSNASAFLIDKNNDDVVQNTFQIFALRLMLSLPVQLCKFHFIDAHSFGRKFNLINRLSHKIVGDSLIDDISKINNLISELEQAVRDANRNYLTIHSWLDEYNKNSGQLTAPYRFVFISNFPVGFNQETTERLYNLINNQNAARAGIYIFYSIDEKISIPYKFDYYRFTNISSYIYPNNEIDYEIENNVFDKHFNDTFNITLSHKLPDNIELIINAINDKANNVKQQVVSLDNEMKELQRNNQYWRANSSNGFRVPIGFTTPGDKVYFEFGGNSSDYFAIIGGRPGYGKTVLLHNIICNASVIYSPVELEFYLIDCTNGTGFKPYDKLPHAKFVSITSEREYTVSALNNILVEMNDRASLFKKTSDDYNISISKIEEYRDITNKKLPRIVVIIDEFQVLLEAEDKIARKAKSYLQKIIQEGRKYGINLVLCTQSFSRLDFNTDLITLRIAFNLLEFDSLKILRNETASKLTKKGEAILNNQNGNLKNNVHFQGAYTNNMIEYVKFSNSKLHELAEFQNKRFVFDGKINADCASNERFSDLFLDKIIKNDISTNIYIGVPQFIRQEHIYFKIRRNQGSNLLMVGNDIKSAISTTLLINYQLIKQSSANSKFYIADFFSSDNQYADYLNSFDNPFNNLQFIKNKEISSKIEEIENELNIRIENDKNNIKNEDRGRIVISLLYIQNAKELKKDGFNQSPITKKIYKLIKDGPDLGIHILVYSYSYKGLLDIIEQSLFSEFENKVVLHEGGSMSILSEQTLTSPSEKGYGLLQTDDEISTYNPDPFVFYTSLSFNNLNKNESFFLTKIFE